MRGQLLLGGGLLLVATWWVAGSRVVAWSEGEAVEVDASVSSPEPAAGPVGAIRRELVADVPAEVTPAIEPPVPPPRPRRMPVPATWRDILVLDGQGRPVAAAEISVGTVYDSDGRRRGNGAAAMTDRTGRARMELSPRTTVRVCAPGFGLGTERVPDGADEWTIMLSSALRLEIAVVGPREFAGFHARVLLPPGCRPGPFYQTRYVQTPGRAVDGTEAYWSAVSYGVGEPRGRVKRNSNWEVSFTPAGTAVLDQIEGTGTVRVQLMHFARVLEERGFEIPHDGVPVHLEFRVSPAPTLRGVVVDANNRPVSGASLRMAPFGGRWIVDSPHWLSCAFPVWAPHAQSDAGGRYVLPRPDDVEERIVVSCAGYAAGALTVAELDAGSGTIELQPGCTVRLHVVDCNGAPLEGGYTTGGHEYEEPMVHLGHDVWRGTGDGELPWFEFAELPRGEVIFRCAGETRRHDARVSIGRFVTEGPVELMGIGK